MTSTWKTAILSKHLAHHTASPATCAPQQTKSALLQQNSPTVPLSENACISQPAHAPTFLSPPANLQNICQISAPNTTKPPNTYYTTYKARAPEALSTATPQTHTPSSKHSPTLTGQCPKTENPFLAS